jgi:hypothetical protein
MMRCLCLLTVSDAAIRAILADRIGSRMYYHSGQRVLAHAEWSAATS